MHHEPLDAAGDAIESAPLPPPRKIVIVPPSELALLCKDLSAIELICFERRKTDLRLISAESVVGAS
jgi:hypothetical protein